MLFYNAFSTMVSICLMWEEVLGQTKFNYNLIDCKPNLKRYSCMDDEFNCRNLRSVFMGDALFVGGFNYFLHILNISFKN